uniref:Putative polysaccharide biosynthesis protein n=1 Tax=viral metagenome TaxID=1070528 RepID=A0A6M3JSK0_9ZZZZ
MEVLITGGTGSFGQAMTLKLLKDDFWERIAIYSRDEFKQHQMIQQFGEFPIGGRLRFFVGDVRDLRNLRRAMKGIDVVIHAAALKQIPSCEYNPWEAVQTNIQGSWNVINASIENGVRKVIILSSDKAVNPINCYGATKLVAEKLFINSNTLGRKITRFSVIRYGNVLASRGSVLQMFSEQARDGALKVTDKRMTRFWWSLREVVDFTTRVMEWMRGGEIFIPKLQSASIVDLARSVSDSVPIEETGIRAGEKIHECLIAPDEIRRTSDMGWAYIIKPDNPFFEYMGKEDCLVPIDFSYTSDNPDFCRKEF